MAVDLGLAAGHEGVDASWKACRLARLASLKPRSAAAFGATSVPSRAISWRRVGEGGRTLGDACRTARARPPGTRRPQVGEEGVHRRQVLAHPVGVFLRVGRVLGGVDAAGFEHDVGHEPVEVGRVEGPAGRVPGLDPSRR